MPVTSSGSFGRVLRRGSVGPDVRAVRRALARAGHGRLAASRLPLFGPFMTRRLERFQASRGLVADGVYGEQTHRRLTPFFDAYAWQLYSRAPKPVPGLQLPADFVATHETAGLPGYPAIDVFADGGTLALSPVTGTVVRTSGHPPTPTTVPGGPYGWSVYIGPFYLTHFGGLLVKAGDRVRRGDPLGTVADYSRATGGITPSHIHEGKRA